MVTKEQLDEYTRAYSNGTPIISDEEYDMLMEEYVKANGEESRPFLRQKQSGDVNELVGTLTKEEWKPCKSNDDKFNGQFISSRGNFKDGDKIVPSYHSTNGHLYCLYRFSGLNVKLIPVESVVVSYFGKHFNINNKHVVHNDGNRSNNTIENLTVIDDIEIWKEVDYPDIQKDRYIISNTGYVKNRITGKILTNCIGQNGYKYVYIKTINGQHKGVLLHRLIATSFVPNPDPKRYNIVNHLDGCPCNNSIINLEWCDQKINSQHAAYTQHMTKLSIQDIDMIRSMLLDKGNRGSASKIYELLKDEYPHISKSQIYAIKHNMCYKRSYTYTDVTDIKYPKYECDNIPTDDIDMIRDMLLSDEYKFSVAAVYKALDHDRYPRITKNVIKAIKATKQSYYRSNKYDLNEIMRIFEKHKELRGVNKHMKSIENNSNTSLDMCRRLLMLRVFHGSPRAVYMAINHNKYPNMSQEIVRHVAYDRISSSSYYRTDSVDLNMFDKVMSNKSFLVPDKQLIDDLTMSYSQGMSDITDEAYDLILEDYISFHGEEARPFFRSKKTGDLNELTATLPKVYGTITPWRPKQTTYSDWIRKKNIGDISIIAQPKFDGCSVALDMNSGRFFTRGDYDNGESVDVTSLFENYDINSLNLHDGISAVKFEAIMSHEVYDQINQNKYKRPRDVVSATITSQNVEMAKYITLVPLREYLNGNEILPRSLVDISMKTTAHNYDKIDGFISNKLADGARVKFNDMTYSIDGVVVSVVDGDTYTGEEVAIKILNNIKETKIINIEYQNGKTGKITPVGILEPVKFDNITVDHVGLANLSRVVELGLKYNDTVRIVYNIVPYLIDSYHDGNVNIPIPTKCPICGAKLNLLTLKTVRCTNPHCTGLKIGMIHRYCEQMKMMGLSKGILTKLFENNLIDSIPDLYKLTPEVIQTIDGFKEKSSRNIVDTIASASQDVPLSRWLGASPIKDVSAKTWQIIINHTFGMDEMTASNVVKHELEHGSPESFMENVVGSYVYGVGLQTFRLIHVGLTTYWEDIRETAKYVTFRITTDLTKPTKGRVTLTGTRDEQLTSYLVEHGYEVDDYSSKTIALVIPNESFISNKVVKARSKGIPIYTIEQAYRELQ